MEAIIDDKNDYPLSARNNILLKPGHLVRQYIFLFEILIVHVLHAQNEVSLSAVKVTPDPDIKSLSPIKRNCYFDHEEPPNKPLKAYQKYSQVRLKLTNIQRSKNGLYVVW